MKRKSSAARSKSKSSKKSVAVTSSETFTLPTENEPVKRPRFEELSLSVTLSPHDKDNQIHLSNDKLMCWGMDNVGFCLIRATHSVNSGKYYWECEILSDGDIPKKSGECNNIFAPPSNGIDNSLNEANRPHVRIGWALHNASLSAPVGYDSFSFAYRDVNGAAINNSKRIDSYGASYSVGDVIGCWITLDKNDSRKNEIRFFKNGKDQGRAFSGSIIVPGMYFPALSVYHKAALKANFGPNFIFPYQQSINKQTNRIGDSGADFTGTLPISELQPMSADLKRHHSEYIAQRRLYHSQRASSVTITNSNNQSGKISENDNSEK